MLFANLTIPLGTVIDIALLLLFVGFVLFIKQKPISRKNFVLMIAAGELLLVECFFNYPGLLVVVCSALLIGKFAEWWFHQKHNLVQ
jgi:hypothetical protein